jgi:hypothetical protein
VALPLFRFGRHRPASTIQDREAAAVTQAII